MKMDMKWYIVSVVNTHEKKIQDAIEKELERSNVAHYVKRIVVAKEFYFQVRKGKKIKMERNFYPGYMMIECEMKAGLAGLIKNIDGVKGFVGGEGREIKPMRESDVKKMLSRIDEIATEEEVEFEYEINIGQNVTIVDGPFASMIGIVTDVLFDKKRVMVDVNIFNRKTPVELKFEQVATT